MSSLLGSFQLLWGEIMNIKKQSREEILAHRKVESSNRDKENGIFYLKDNVDIKVMEHGDLYEDCEEEVRYAVCCPECGEIVFLENGSRTSEKHGDPESDVFSSEKITYDLVCSSCNCRFKTTEHIKKTAWSIIFLIYVPIVMCFLSFMFILIGEVVEQDKIKLISSIVFACFALWLIVLYAIAFIFGNSEDGE